MFMPMLINVSASVITNDNKDPCACVNRLCGVVNFSSWLLTTVLVIAAKCTAARDA